MRAWASESSIPASSTGAPQDARFVGMAMRGHGLVRQGRFAEAEPDLEQSVEIARKAGEREGEMLLLTALTYVYHKLGRTDKAIVAGERMLELMRELGEPDDLPIALRCAGAGVPAAGQYGTCAGAGSRSL